MSDIAFVTGASGFVGAAVARAALARGFAGLTAPPRNAAAIGVLHNPTHQIFKPNAEVSRLLWDERSGGHTGLGVDL